MKTKKIRRGGVSKKYTLCKKELDFLFWSTNRFLKNH